jgi:nitrilase
LMEKVTVAAVQATPEFLDRDATVQKVVRLTKEAAGTGARLIVFPETFIPTYPDWVWRAAPWDGVFEALTARLREESVEVPSSATEELGKVARRAKAHLSVGVNELDGGTIYNAQLLFGPDGSIERKHRKLMPTGGERRAAGLGLRRRLGPRPRRHAVRTHRSPDLLGEPDAAGAHLDLREGCGHLDRPDMGQRRELDREPATHRTRGTGVRDRRVHVAPRVGHPRRHPGASALGRRGRLGNPGWSAIVDPDGQVLAGPLIKEEGILTAEVDAQFARAQRYRFDPVGHYSRPDVFLIVNDAPKPSVTSE